MDGHLSKAIPVEQGGDDLAAQEQGDDCHGQCLNCEAPLLGEYCHQCGQEAHVHRSFSAIFHEFAHGVVHFEGRFWNSLPLLTWRPGDLTRRYIAGERARFMSPLGLFLLSVFLTYAVFSLIGGAHVSEVKAGPAIRAERQQQVAQEMKAANEEMEAALAKSFTVEAGVFERDVEQLVEKVRANPKLVFYKLQANAYKFAWALIPISLPFLWLLFPFSRCYHPYDHFVFITYSISFMLFLSSIARIVALTPLADLAIMAAMAFVPVHMFRQLREAYALSAMAALWRTVLLAVMSLLIGVAFVMGLFVMGASSL